MKTKMYALIALVTLPLLALFNNCGGSGGGGGGGSGGGSVVQVPIKISSGGITVGLNEFKFHPEHSRSKIEAKDLFEALLWETANATTTYRVSPDKARLRLTGFSFQPVETSVDTSTESAFNSALSCEVDYDKTTPNQSFDCIVELQVGLHYKTIDFKVAPNVDIYINDSTNSIYTTAAGLTGTNPGASLDYYTATFGNNNTSFHAEFPFQLDTTYLNTTLQKITTHDGCSNVIETKMLLSNGTVLSDVTSTPGSACGTPGTSTSTVNIGTQNLNVVVDMIHGIQVDKNGTALTVNTTVPWWTVVGTIGAGASIKHYASTASGLTSATYQFPPSQVGINELKVAYANGVAVAAQMVPNGYSGSFCHDDYDTPNNSPGNGYVGSDANGAAWAVGPYSNGAITNYTSEYYLNTSTNVFYCKTISSDPSPSPGQTLNSFSTNMPNPTSWPYSLNMSRID